MEGRKESALKYMGMWGSRKVNINTAPRHVLEAAFIFGGDQVTIAEEIIQRRQIEPFASIGDLKTAMPRYSGSIAKCEKYITTVSGFFTIKVIAVSGVAKASSVIAITKEANKVQRVALIND
jgi:type II secretory pathway component PulK